MTTYFMIKLTMRHFTETTNLLSIPLQNLAITGTISSTSYEKLNQDLELETLQCRR